MKNIKLTDFLTTAQIADALKLWHSSPTGSTFHKAVLAEIVKPNITEINRKLAQANDPAWIAYVIEYVFMQEKEGS